MLWGGRTAASAPPPAAASPSSVSIRERLAGERSLAGSCRPPAAAVLSERRTAHWFWTQKLSERRTAHCFWTQKLSERRTAHCFWTQKACRSWRSHVRRRGGWRRLRLRDVVQQIVGFVVKVLLRDPTQPATHGAVRARRRLRTAGPRRCLSREGSGKTQGQRQCLSREGSGNTQGKGGVLAAKAVETHKAKAVS